MGRSSPTRLQSQPCRLRSAPQQTFRWPTSSSHSHGSADSARLPLPQQQQKQRRHTNQSSAPHLSSMAYVARAAAAESRGTCPGASSPTSSKASSRGPPPRLQNEEEMDRHVRDIAGRLEATLEKRIKEAMSSKRYSDDEEGYECSRSPGREHMQSPEAGDTATMQAVAAATAEQAMVAMSRGKTRPNRLRSLTPPPSVGASEETMAVPQNATSSPVAPPADCGPLALPAPTLLPLPVASSLPSPSSPSQRQHQQQHGQSYPVQQHQDVAFREVEESLRRDFEAKVARMETRFESALATAMKSQQEEFHRFLQLAFHRFDEALTSGLQEHTEELASLEKCVEELRDSLPPAEDLHRLLEAEAGRAEREANEAAAIAGDGCSNGSECGSRHGLAPSRSESLLVGAVFDKVQADLGTLQQAQCKLAEHVQLLLQAYPTIHRQVLELNAASSADVAPVDAFSSEMEQRVAGLEGDSKRHERDVLQLATTLDVDRQERAQGLLEMRNLQADIRKELDESLQAARTKLQDQVDGIAKQVVEGLSCFDCGATPATALATPRGHSCASSSPPGTPPEDVKSEALALLRNPAAPHAACCPVS